MKKYLSVAALFCFWSCHSSSNTHTIFHLLDASKTGIAFSNTIIENDSINPIDMEFLYNGGGVAVADFNNDSLPDLYFTGSMVANKLYLNQGKFHFTDITEKAGVYGEGEWSNGATIVDINNDGWQDIYVCTSIKKDPSQRRNLLYVNQGNGKGGVPVFKEMAAAYGLADTSYSVQAAFADLDNDGDLDMYLVTTKLAKREGAQFNNNTGSDTSAIDVDKLFRNDWSDSAGHPVFTDISRQAGIRERGFGLSVSVADVNKDGWKDIYVANDFYGSDALYINNRNGTFTNKANTFFKHTSQNAMGNDIADINNDGLPDILTVDMNPEDNFRKKKNMSGSNYYVYQNMMYQNVMLQYVRNTLQLNRGALMSSSDSIGDPVFSDIGFFAGVAQTDWSWSPSIADFDNDGSRDIIITNGYPKDVTDHDFAAFRYRNEGNVSKQQLIDEIPQIKLPNYAYQNEGGLSFRNVTAEWGLDKPCFSTGAVYVDLDNDGDLDYVINNINEEAYVYENTLNDPSKRFFDIRLKGGEHNRNGIGACVELHYKDHLQVMECSSTHGYLSSPENKLHFGLGAVPLLDSVVIRWPAANKKQVLTNMQTNRCITADIRNASQQDNWTLPAINDRSVFTDITRKSHIQFVHKEADVIDFNNERLLPHKLSEYGPGLAVGDINGDGLDDLFTGGTGDFPAHFFLQQQSGTFTDKILPPLSGSDDRRPENMGLLFFDADNDGDLDLYCANGSNEFAANTKNYQDRLYLNDGKGNYTIDTAALPLNYTSKSCIKAADIDNDGDLDLFVGGRVEPGRYPAPVSSSIYRNDTKNGVVRFTDITSVAARALTNIGLVCDAVWTDFNNDRLPDLIVTGEWMPITFFRNTGNGKFENITGSTTIANHTGWWNSITAGDFDNDGDIDYVVGNLGQNSFYQPTEKYPVQLYASDFDKNGSLDVITTVYLKDKQGSLKEFPAASRDEIVEQMPALKKQFLTYKEFGEAGIEKFFPPQQLQKAMTLKVNDSKSSFLKNNGDGTFRLIPLPPEAQLAPVFGMVADDINQDGNLDILLCGNDYGTEVTNGRYDAMNGLILTGNGDGTFKPMTAMQSGLSITGNAKALVKLKGSGGHYLLAASENKGPLKLYQARTTGSLLSFMPDEGYAILTFSNGKTRRMERYFGSSFLSQSADFIVKTPAIEKIDFYHGNTLTRTVK